MSITIMKQSNRSNRIYTNVLSFVERETERERESEKDVAEGPPSKSQITLF